MRSSPAVLGGTPAFAQTVPLTRPTLPPEDDIFGPLSQVLDSGMITNGSQVRAFEEEAAAYLGVRDVVAVCNCTSGLMLLLRCLEIRGDVVIPSFTFMASGHAAAWNGLALAFADSDPQSFTLSFESAASASHSAGAILATHTFGAPCDVEALAEVASRRGIPLLFDAAHAFGSVYPDGTMVGSKGLAEVFSLSPTKPMSTGEGGLIATNDTNLARELRTAREYGNPGNYDSVRFGLNGRMTEWSAIVGRASLRRLPEWLNRRRELADRYRASLSSLPGITFQQIPSDALSSFKDFAIRVGPEFGLTRDELAACLVPEGISSRSYFNPPLHRQTAYRETPVTTDLKITEELSDSLLTLPLYSHMDVDVIDRISERMNDIHAHRESVSEVLCTQRLGQETSLAARSVR